MIVGLITELSVVGVYERGVPNQERIVIVANELVEMGRFGVLLGLRQQSSAFPIRDNFYWFGEGTVNKGDWIYLYTGPGATRTIELPGTTEKVYSLHWGRDRTVLDHQELVPILFRVDAVNIPAQQLQIADQQQG